MGQSTQDQQSANTANLNCIRACAGASFVMVQNKCAGGVACCRQYLMICEQMGQSDMPVMHTEVCWPSVLTGMLM